MACPSALLCFPLAEKLKAWIVLVDTKVKLDTTSINTTNTINTANSSSSA